MSIVSDLVVYGPAAGLATKRYAAITKYPNIIASDVALRRLRRERAAIISNERRSRVVVLGDSTSAGRGSGAGDAELENGARAKCPASAAARILTAAGFPARADAWMGDANVNPSTLAHYTEYNPDVSFGANWVAGLPTGLGGKVFSQASPNSSAIVFTPQKDADRFTIPCIQSGTNGTFTVTDASGTLATVNTTGVSNLVQAAVTRAVASQVPINIQRSSGNTVYIMGAEAWNSTLAEYCIVNAGVIGWASGDYIKASNIWEPSLALAFLAYNLVYLEVGANDVNLGVSMATYLSNISALAATVTAASGPGSLIIGITAPGTAGGSFDLPLAWRQGLVDIALANDVVLVDNYSRFVSRASDTTLYSDGIHLKAAGSAMKGDLLACALMA